MIVVKDAGAEEIYYSHWGGDALHLDLVAGPDAAVRFATAQRREQRWVADLVAAAVIDVGRSVLLWYSRSLGETAALHAVLETMRETWTGWTVHWARGADGELIRYCEGRRPMCSVFIVENDRPRVYASPLPVRALIEAGPGVVEQIAVWESPDKPESIPAHGLILVPADRVGAHWAFDGSADDIDVARAGWGEWNWEDWRPRLEAEAGIERLTSSRMAGAFTELSAAFDKHQVLDSGTELAAVLLNATGWIEQALRSGGGNAVRVEDNSFTHRPVELTEGEVLRTRVAIRSARSRFEG
ncbi:hypothetical protein [Nocardia sp. AG03]|uniref:hypothetical protein n=1 Tax=Nocardia sp. AG03 TaxID=3025312 RepID=UPI0024184A83|nr:hypothetical protein [Nocardia sp. AG03]